MGAATGDVDGDGDLDLFVAAYGANLLFDNLGDGSFREVAAERGVADPAWGSSAAFADVEGDGDLDLVVGNGHVFDNAAEFIPGSDYALADHLYLNDGGGRFELLEFPEPPLSSRGVVSGDLDGDGDPDLAITACGGRLRLWRNEAGAPERFLLVELQGAPPNSDAYGARLTARVGGRELRREVATGGSYASQGDRRVTFGLGTAAGVEGLSVRWPDGTADELPATGGGRLLLLRQGEGLVDSRPLVRGPA